MKYARIQFTSCPNHILTTVTAKTENQQKQQRVLEKAYKGQDQRRRAKKRKNEKRKTQK